MLGVAFMAGTLVLTDTIGKTFDGLFADAYAGTDAFVRGESALDGSIGDQPPRRRLARRHRRQRRRRRARSRAPSTGYAQLVDHDGKAVGNPARVRRRSATTWIDDADLNPYDLVEATPRGRRRDRHRQALRRRPPTSRRRDRDGADQGRRRPVHHRRHRHVRRRRLGRRRVRRAVHRRRRPAATSPHPASSTRSPFVAADGVSQEHADRDIAEVAARRHRGAHRRRRSPRRARSDVKDRHVVLQHVPAGLRRHRPVRRCVHHLQHLLDHRRPAHRRRWRCCGRSAPAAGRSCARCMLEATVVGVVASVAGLGRRHRRRCRAEDAARSASASTSRPAAWSSDTSTIVIVDGRRHGRHLASAFFPARKAGKVPPIAAMRDVAVDQHRRLAASGRSSARRSPAPASARCSSASAAGPSAGRRSAPSSPSSASPCSARCSPVRQPACSAGRLPRLTGMTGRWLARTPCATPSARPRPPPR